MVIVMGSLSDRAGAAPPAVTVSANADTIPRYDIYELTMTNAGNYANPWEDVVITAIFNSPSAKTYTVGGFYYDTNTWKLRFAPMETGTWTWSLTFDNGSGQFTTTGSFAGSASANTGFLRKHPTNVRHLVTEGDGKPFYINGYNVQYTTSRNVSPLGGQVDAAPPHAKFPLLEVFNTFRRGGLNIYRNNTQATDNILQYNVSGTGKNVYGITEGKRYDEVAVALHQSGLKYMLCFWGDTSSYGLLHGTFDFTGTGERAATLSLHKYILNRYGAYVDIWELGNEFKNATQTYLDAITGLCATNDPYQHLTTISFPQYGSYTNSNPNEGALMVANGHRYTNATNLDLDKAYANSPAIATLKSTYPTKPVFLGECGNSAPIGNYDPERYRIGIWTGFTNEGGLIYWLRIDSKFTTQASGLSNMYIGPEERAMSRIMTNFTSDMDPLVTTISRTITPANLRGYLLGSSQDIVGYFVHTDSHATTLNGGQLTLTVPANGMLGQWIDPATGAALQTFTVSAGSRTLGIPDFACDIALRIRTAPAAAKIEFSSASYLAQENQGLLAVTVNRSVSSTGAVAVNYATSDGLARSGTNYTAASGTLNWAAGDTAPKTVVIYLQNNNTGENDKDFQITLSSPTGGAALGNNGSALVTVFDMGTAAGAAPGITSALTASGTAGAAFNYTISGSGNPTSYKAIGLPAGLTPDTASGTITGTTTATGTFNVALGATNAYGTGTATLVLTINPPVQLFDAWASSYGLSGNNALATATPAGDGVTNLIKYALGLNPNQPGVALTDGVNPGLPLVATEGTNLTMIYQKNVGKSDINYAAVGSLDLFYWDTAGITESVLHTSGNIQTIKAVLATGNDQRKFIRLKVTRP